MISQTHLAYFALVSVIRILSSSLDDLVKWSRMAVLDLLVVGVLVNSTSCPLNLVVVCRSL